MARITSIFGSLATSEGMRMLIDKSKDLFAVPQWQRFCDWGVPSLGLTYSTVIGSSRIEAMASVVDVDAAYPLRSRQGLSKLEGDIPAMKEKFKMSQKMFREYQTLKSLPGLAERDKLNMALDMMFNDIRTAGNSPHMRLDFILLQMLSTAKVQIVVAENPDGIVTDEVDLLMPDANKYKTQTAVWSTSATADPIKDIKKVVKEAAARGVRYERMLMDDFSFENMIATEKMGKYIIGVKPNPDALYLLSQSAVNNYLVGNGLPMIEIVSATMGVESDGVITSKYPWKEGQVTFLPAGKVGTMHNAVSIEKMNPVAGISYAEHNRALISKWSENDPWAEYTAVELLAFPGWENIDQCAILDTKTNI